jgi:hypothetical protein
MVDSDAKLGAPWSRKRYSVVAEGFQFVCCEYVRYLSRIQALGQAVSAVYQSRLLTHMVYFSRFPETWTCELVGDVLRFYA